MEPSWLSFFIRLSSYVLKMAQRQTFEKTTLTIPIEKENLTIL